MKYVKFFLDARYYQNGRTSNGMERETCIKILLKSFSQISTDHIRGHMQKYRCGFNIVCTAEQFSAFIIHRNNMGECINGIKDLFPEFVAERLDPMTEIKRAIGRKSGASNSSVYAVLDALDSWSFEDTSHIDRSVLNIMSRS